MTLFNVGDLVQFTLENATKQPYWEDAPKNHTEFHGYSHTLTDDWRFNPLELDPNRFLPINSRHIVEAAFKETKKTAMIVTETRDICLVPNSKLRHLTNRMFYKVLAITPQGARNVWVCEKDIQKFVAASYLDSLKQQLHKKVTNT